MPPGMCLTPLISHEALACPCFNTCNVLLLAATHAVHGPVVELATSAVRVSRCRGFEVPRRLRGSMQGRAPSPLVL